MFSLFLSLPFSVSLSLFFRYELYVEAYSVIHTHDEVKGYLPSRSPEFECRPAVLICRPEKHELKVPDIPTDRPKCSWGGNLHSTYRSVPMIECDGSKCGAKVTGYYMFECVVLTTIRRFWLADKKVQHPGFSNEDVKAWRSDFDVKQASLPEYTHPALIRINRWVREKEPEELDEFPQGWKRFILYYFFAIDVFGARHRIRLPDCVVTAIRSKYPNPAGVPYVGHKD